MFSITSSIFLLPTTEDNGIPVPLTLTDYNNGHILSTNCRLQLPT